MSPHATRRSRNRKIESSFPPGSSRQKAGSAVRRGVAAQPPASVYRCPAAEGVATQPLRRLYAAAAVSVWRSVCRQRLCGGTCRRTPAQCRLQVVLPAAGIPAHARFAGALRRARRFAARQRNVARRRTRLSRYVVVQCRYAEEDSPQNHSPSFTVCPKRHAGSSSAARRCRRTAVKRATAARVYYHSNRC